MTSHQNTKPLVIGKASKQCCFPNLNTDQLSVTWRHIKKALMSSLFTFWLSDFNRKMYLQKRNVLLSIDSPPSSPKDQTYTNVKFHFFPANSVSKLHPFCLTSHYRKQLLQKVTTQVNQHQEASEIAKGIIVYDACVWTGQAQKCSSQETVQKCLGKCGFVSDPDMYCTQQNSVQLTLNCQVFFRWLPTQPGESHDC